MAITVGLISLGCSKNRIDSEQMLAVLSAHGYKVVHDPAKAEIIIVNTCGFIEAAKEEAIATLFEMAEYKKYGRCRLLAATGCFAQRYPEAIRQEMPEVDIIMGVNEYEKLDQAIREAQDGTRPVYTDDDGSFFEYGRVLTTPRYSAYVRIGEGCDNFCSFCAIPLIRGFYRSRGEAEILEEIRTLAQDGVKEIMLLGQNVNSYGKTLQKPVSFAELLDRAAKIDGIERIRFMTSHPKDLSEDLIRSMARNPKVCRHLHLPLQSGSTRILEKMNRRYTKDRYLELVSEIREAIPDISLTTDIIVGFPGETEEDFQETMDVVRRVRYDSAFTFLYSKRTGTPAASMENQIDEETMHDRFDRLLRVVQEIGREQTARFTGQVMPVLVESVNAQQEELVTGRLGNNTVVHFPGSASLIGEIVPVRLEECRGFYYLGTQIPANT